MSTQSNPTRVLVLVGLIAAAGGGAWLTRATAGQEPPSSIPPHPPPTPRPTPLQVPFDLLEHPADEVVRLTAPGGRALQLVLHNRPPSARYRIAWSTPDHPANSHVRFIDPSIQTRVRTRPLPSVCDGVVAARKRFLAIDVEAAVPAGLSALETVHVPAACVTLQSALDDAARSTTETVVSSRLRVGVPLSVEIARLAAEGDDVLRRWRLELSAEVPGPAWRWADETQWILGETAVDLLEILQRAAGRDAGEPRFALTCADRDRAQGCSVAVQGEGAPLEASLSRDPVWRPDAYAELAAGAVRAWGARVAPGGTPDTEVPARLATPTSATIEEQNRLVSRRLAESPGSAAAHEDAALVLAALALRESSDDHYDVRASLNRITAHLAAAGALRQEGRPAGTAGYLAHVTLLALAGRQVEAMGLLESPPGTSPAVTGWIRALRVRITGDWRILEGAETPSLLERYEQVRALAAALGRMRALEYLREERLAADVNWGRLLLDRTAPVAVGNVFAEAVAEEMSDAAGILTPETGGERSLDGLRESLTGPGGCLRLLCSGSQPRVISRGLWSGFFERHLLAAVDAVEVHAREALGLEEQALEVRRSFAEALGELPLFASLGLQWQGGRWTNDELCERAASLTQISPSRLAPRFWERAERLCARQRDAGAVRPPESWFRAVVPTGTSYDISSRVAGLLKMANSLAPAAWRSALDRAPWDTDAAKFAAAFVYRGEATLEQLEELYAPTLDYHMTPLYRLAGHPQHDREAQVPYRSRLCDLNADHCAALGGLLVREARDEEAVAVFERAFREARDRVGVSIDMSWLVGHYAETGSVERALAIARAGAQVFSQAGLEIYGRLLERLGRDEEALDVFRKLDRRYEGTWDLYLFLIARAHRLGDGRYAEETRAATEVVFPDGLERVVLEDFVEPPREGVRIINSSRRLEQMGLAEGDIIVALDGYRVKNHPQYACVRRFDYDAPISLIVHSGGRYVERTASLPQRSFNALMQAWPSDPPQ